MKVVIVDDDRLVSMSLKTILESDKNITVAACGQDGEEAVALYRQYQPDVLLMDIQMIYKQIPLILLINYMEIILLNILYLTKKK